MAQTVDEARGRMEVAKATADRTEAMLGYRELTAPFDGVITMRYVDPGAFIPAATAGGAAGNGAVVTVMDFATVRVQVPVPEVEAALVRKGQPVTVTVPGLPGKKFAGKVDRFSYALDESTKTMLVEADLPNPELELRPGMYATVAIGVERHEGVLLLPVGAVLMEKAGASVFVNDGGKAKKAPVKAGFNDGMMVEVNEGLTGNEAVIVIAGGVLPADGQAISAKEAK
jgi:RND family efflux transporter MFP subunit